MTMPYYGAYNASKYALEGFSLTLRQELRGSGIHVSIINPGPIESELRSNAHKIFQEKVAGITTGAHQQAYNKLQQAYFKPDASSRNIRQKPDAVLKKLIHALDSKNPNAHYFIGWPAQLLAVAKRILPDRVFEYLLSKV
jgi:short-subunit dehydrogenase